MNQQTLDKLGAQTWARFAALYPGVGEMPRFVLSNRLRVTVAYCDRNNRVIVLGNKFFKQHARYMLMTVLPHEVAHQIDYDLNGEVWENEGHGATWCDIMTRYGLAPQRHANIWL